MEELLAVIDRILVTVRDGDPNGEMKSQHLGLTVKEKLPEEYIREYKYWLYDRGEEDCFEKLVEWIETRVQIMDEAKEESGQLIKTQKPGERRNRGFGTSSEKRQCVVSKCKEDHPPWAFPEFKKLSVSQRKECIVKTRRCFKCLAAGHLSKDCKRNRICGVSGCKSSGHSSYLHDPDWKPPKKEHYCSESTESDVGGAVVKKAGAYNSTEVESVSLMVLPAILSSGAKSLKVNVMLDPCSTGSYVSENAAEEIQLTGRRQNLTISGTGGTEIKKRSTRVQCAVSSIHGSFSAKIQANVLDNITGSTPAIKWSDLKKDWEHLKTIPFDQVSNRKHIDLLIGSDHPAFHQVLREMPGRHPKDPVARQTPLGWVCFGPTCKDPQPDNSHSHMTRTYRTPQTNVAETNDLLRKFWELESIGIREERTQAMNQDEMKAVKRAQMTQKKKDGRYEIGIPWRDGEPKFKNNYDMAYSRLKNLENSLSKKPEVASAYRKIIEDYQAKGYVKKMPLTNNKQWLLPHFAVVNNEKTTTKVRIIFDAAAKHDEKGLNEAIYPGPKLQRELVDVLTRFRRAPVAISADISQIFLQVGLIEEDRPYHRFLWRDLDQTKQPEMYKFERLPFGNTASPFCAQHVLHTHAETHKDAFPEAADTVDNAMYVDDVLDSCETVCEATNLRRQTTALMQGAGFTLKKWMSNEVKVIEDKPIEDRLPGLKIQDGSLPTVKTLGVLWQADHDTFSFHIQSPPLSELPTKRNVLRAIAKLFDPFRVAGFEWDELLRDDLCAEWRIWTNQLMELSCFEIPRPLRLANQTHSSLHTFSDASKDTYAAVSYLVCTYDNHPTTSRLITSKSRVSPLKSVTIPRLELMGAVLACRLAKSLLETLQVDEAMYWTDSTNVLYWIHNQSRIFKPFVANRTAEIQRHTNPDQWRHIPGEQNPADLPTRGLSATEICTNKLWMEGASFLTDEELPWPEKLPPNPPVDTTNHEGKKTQTHATKESPTLDGTFRLQPQFYSSWRRFVRVTAWVKRFISNCKSNSESRVVSSILLQDELKGAQIHWIRQTQTKSFPGKEKDKFLLRFSPQVDEHGLLRVDGRLRLAQELPYNTRHPIILPKHHPVTRLVIVDAHEKLGHGTGIEHLLTELRSKFWVVKGRQMVRTIVRRCPGCLRRFRTKPAEQKMAPLPSSRITLPLRAFERIGTDFAGPFLTKQGRGKSRMKRYLCLFTCLATRAVHLEMAYSLDTDAFINAFVRMTSRRGMPTYVISDNGTNFVAGEKEIRQKVQEFDQKIVNTTTTNQAIEWKFNPPAAPHFGGVFESMIKSAKRALRAILGDAEITDEELHTAICSAEGLLNSRPITFVSSSSDDMAPLTPSHFLVGHLGGQFAPESEEEEEIYSPKKRWRRIQQLVGHFWKRWRKEFLPSLNVRGKWFSPKRDLAVDDVVMVVEPNAKRGEWPLGRVLEVYPGADNLIRVVKVRVGNNEYIRPVHRLCPLERDP